MTRCLPVLTGLLLCVVVAVAQAAPPAHPLDRVLASENVGVQVESVPVLEDLPFLRRITIDLIGRIPTTAEVEEFMAWPSSERREMVIDKLLADGRFADRWTIFYADMLRLRSNAEGGNAFLAFVHQAVETGMPYDEMCRQLISANGKANYSPQVGFILGDGADPMALAGVTAQTFLGIRVACAQCHDHPFDVWTRENFYGLAAYFGKTRRYENQFTNTVFTRETDEMTVLWPPEGVVPASERKPMVPTFPFELADEKDRAPVIARLEKLREARRLARKPDDKEGPSLDDLLAEAEDAVKKVTDAKPVDETGVTAELKKDVKGLKLDAGIYGESELRAQLSSLITSPRNTYFSRSFVNRVWAELVGIGFVEPVDDFSEGNQPSHPQALNLLADEFVANGYDLRKLIRMIVTSDTYQRGHSVGDAATRSAAEAAFVAMPNRRMISEVLYDSIVVAGHLTEPKHAAGKNEMVVWRLQQIPKTPASSSKLATNNLAGGTTPAQKPAMAPKKTEPEVASAAYDLEKAIELDFAAVLNAKDDDEPEVEQMKMVSKEELEAEMMSRQMNRPGVQYIDRYVRMVVDDNPSFSTAMRMATPAPPSHFLRIFGQPTRDSLGDFRDSSATMRQALMMLNGRLTHEASRVGELEPVFVLLDRKTPDMNGAIRLVYRELLTRDPSAAEAAEAVEIVKSASTVGDGIADLRWVLYNSHEFRFIP